MPEYITGEQPLNENPRHYGNDISGIEIKMLPPFIRDNTQLKIWPFTGYAKLYCLTTVVSDVADELTGIMDLAAFPRVAKTDYLPIDKTIYYWQDSICNYPPPNQVHIMCTIIRSREKLHDPQQVLADVKADKEYNRLVDHLRSVLAGTASFAMVTDMTMKVAAIISRYLGKTDAMPVATVVDSFSRADGDWDKPGIKQVNMSTKNADFGFELVVHNDNRFATARTVQGIPLFDTPGDGFHTMTAM